jgi:hypothetical protein
MAKFIEIRGFVFTEIAGTVYVRGSGIRGAGIALGNAESLNLGMFQGLDRVPAVGAAAAEDLAAFTQADVDAIKAALQIRPPPAQPQPTEPPPAQTAAVDVQAAQSNNPATPPVEKVTATGAVVIPPATTAPTNADVPVTTDTGGGDQNTNPPVKTLAQTQSTNGQSQARTGVDQNGNAVGFGVRDEAGTFSALRRNPETGELYDPGGIPSAFANVEPGVGANDNNPPPSATATQADVNAANPTISEIKPQPNILDRFSSYTYQASVYLLSNAQFAAYQASQTKSVNGYNLLFQSGGAPNNIGGPQGTLGTAYAAAQADLENEGIGFAPSTPTTPGSGQPDAGRNPFFPNDYYIDSIKITNKLFGKNTSAAHSVTELKFTVIEPANISLIDNIYQAVQDMAPKGASGTINYAAAVYLMVVRFYGYDQNGNLQRIGAPDPNTGLSDANALIEKFIPFRIKNINWSVAGKLVSYEFDCAPIGQLIAGGTKRGTIPADVELSGSTVSNMLRGQAVYGNTPAPSTPRTTTTADRTQTDGRNRGQRSDTQQAPPAPPKATAAPNNKKTIQQGLIEAMNAEQKRLVENNTYQVADIYELEFANGAKEIEDATVAKPGKPVNKNATAVATPVSQNTSSASPDKGGMDVTSRSVGITAGMQLLQAIELIIRNSSYITNQANIIINETTGKPEPKPGNENSDFKWFSILMQATPLEYDEKRNDFAYRVKYIVIPYSPAEMKSSYFPDVKFPGLVKRYPWWFTGENTSVLNYTATFNKLYIQTLTGSSPSTSALANIRRTQATSMREIPFISYQSRSTESASGAEGKTNEIAANAAEYLYNPADNASAKVKIIGDPAWIQQGSVAGALSPSKISYAPFEPDGTINFDVRDVLFELVWQRPEDYDLTTGLADPYARTQKIYGDRQPVQSIVYRAKEVVSTFNQGRFEQDIDAVIYSLPIPQKNNQTIPNKAVTAAQPAADDGSYDRLEAKRQTKVKPTGPGRTGQPTTTAQTTGRPQPSNWVRAGAAETGGGAAVGNPTLTRATTLGNPNIRPGSLRERAAQANAARAANSQTTGPKTVPDTVSATVVGAPTPARTPANIVPLPPPAQPVSNGQTVGIVDRILNRLAGQDPATGTAAVTARRGFRSGQSTADGQPKPPQVGSRDY